MLADVYIFNPTCEMAVGNGMPSFRANARLQQFEQDLDLLPLSFTRQDDYLLVNRIPSSSFLSQFEKAGWEIPSFRLIQEIERDKYFQQVPKGFLRPWGWSPAMHHKLHRLKATCSRQFSALPNADWHPDHRKLYSRETALEILQDVSNRNPSSFQMAKEMHPVRCESEEAVQKLLKRWNKIVMKAPWSSSGRGIQIVDSSEWKPFHGQWIQGTIQRHGKVMVEPFLNKETDFAFQFQIDEKEQVNFLGISWFKTNLNGQYELNYINQVPSLSFIRDNGFFSASKR